MTEGVISDIAQRFYHKHPTLLLLNLNGVLSPLYLLCKAAQVTHSAFGVAWTGLLFCGWQHKLCACVVGWLIEPLHLFPLWRSLLNSLCTEVRVYTERVCFGECAVAYVLQLCIYVCVSKAWCSFQFYSDSVAIIAEANALEAHRKSHNRCSTHTLVFSSVHWLH